MRCGLLFALFVAPVALSAQTTSPSAGAAVAQAPTVQSQPITAPPGDTQVPVVVPALPDGTQSAQPSTEASPEAAKAKDNDNNDKAAKAEKDDNDAVLKGADLHHPVLWHDPGNIAALDLYLGQGGRDGQPAPPFTFESEDTNGTNPKFDARDANGKEWRVKLGVEARPEVVASRLLWAMGYYVEDDYVLESAEVSGLHLKRGGDMAKGGHIEQARFARKPEGQKKIGIWQWKDNPFLHAREFDGLRVMMAVMNNWDLKDVNNAVYEDKKNGHQIFLANDVGATFGTNGLSWTRARSKGNVGSFKGSKFITRLTDTEVDFATPAAPNALLAETGGFGIVPYAKRADLDWIGNGIPRTDARWIGSLLAQLTHQQLVDAFRAGSFPPDVIDMYVALVESRIAELKAL
jgi:hypothetical protein